MLALKDVYSEEKLLINPNEVYLFFCNGDQTWTNWFIRTTPKGYFNLLASIKGLRLKHVKCFCLCGAYNQNDASAFAIGMHNEVVMQEAGKVSFFCE